MYRMSSIVKTISHVICISNSMLSFDLLKYGLGYKLSPVLWGRPAFCARRGDVVPGAERRAAPILRYRRSASGLVSGSEMAGRAWPGAERRAGVITKSVRSAVSGPSNSQFFLMLLVRTVAVDRRSR